jgi:hypothetical protein
MDNNTLNNLFESDEVIDLVKQMKRTGKVPPQIDRPKRFKRKYKDFDLEGEDLVYDGRVVVKKADTQATLKNLYDSKDGVGKGVINFYKLTARKFVNITRGEVREFLNAQPNYQMTRQIQHRTNKPIVAEAPNLIWAIDLVDVSNYEGSNRSWNYLFVCVDVFSRKVWIERLKTKGGEQTAKALKAIIDRAGIEPNTIMSDNGTEFKGAFSEFCRQRGIKQSLSRTYSPEANGLVERANQEIRKIMRGFMVKNGDLNWTRVLTAIEENKNGTYNQNTKASADEIWSPDKEKPDLRTEGDDKKVIAQQTARERVKQEIEKFKEVDDFKKGEAVRVKMSSLFSGVRRLVKTKLTKQIVVSYSPEVFKIEKVVIPRKNMLARRRYYLENSDGLVITTPSGNRKPFYASELIRAGADTQGNMTMAKALRLNKVDSTKNDLNF